MGALGVGILFLVASGTGSGTAEGYALLPLADDGAFLSNLSVPTTAPGQGSALDLALADPLSVPMAAAVLALSFYAFNGFPGNETGPVPLPAPTLTAGGVTGLSANLSIGTLAAGTRLTAVVPISVPSGAPEGTYALRDALTFVANGTSYRLESRGFFSAALWENATHLPNGRSTLNLTMLGVSGVLPETALLVHANPYVLPLAILLGVAAVLAAAGGFVYFRKGPGSRVGARGSPDEKKAPSAFGKRRTSDGD